MTIRSFVKLLLGCLIVLAAIVAALIIAARINRGVIFTRLEDRYQSYQLAQELRQSSDDLTSFARSYVATGDPRYEQYYRDVLAIRAGLAPLPEHYEREYWDFYIDLGRPPRPASAPISLLDRMKSAGFTDAELAAMAEAQDRSNALVQTEETAMHAMKGQYRDAAGNFTRKGPPDQALAIRLMNDAAYQHQKALIMQPIDQVMRMEQERNAATLAAFNHDTTVNFRIIEGVLGVFMALVLLSYPLLRRRILSPVAELQGQTRSVAADLDRLAAVTQQVAQGDLTQTYSVSAEPIASTRRDEIGELSRLHDAMIGKLSETGAAIAEMTAELHRLHEQRFRALFENSLAGIYILQDGLISELNPAMAAMFGYSPEEAIGASPLAFVHPDDQAFVAEHLRRRLSGEKDEDRYEFRGVRKDGSTIHVETLVRTLELNGRPVVIGNAIDVTKRTIATRALEESETRVRLLLDSTAEAIVGIDLQGKCTFANRSSASLLGYADQKAFLGWNMHTMIHHTRADGEPYPIEECSIFTALKCGQPDHVDDEVFWRADGSSFQAECWTHPILRDGQAVGAVVTFLDITERKRAEQAIRDSEARFRTVLDNAPVSVGMSRDGQVIYVNRKTIEDFGYQDADEFVGQPLSKFYDDDRRAKGAASADGQPQDGPQASSYEATGLRKDGSRFPVRVEATTVKLPDGPARLGFALDITSQVREKEALLEKARLQERLDGIVSTVPGAIYSFALHADGTMAIPYASARYRELTGMDPSEVRDDAAPAFAQMHPEDRDAVKESIFRSLRDLSEWRQEFRIDHPERGTVWIDGNSLPARRPDGEVLWHGYLSDITRSKLLEQQVLQAQKMEAVGQLAGGIAHDFNNVIGSILGWADICIEKAAGDAEQQKRLQRIRNQANLAANLTKQLLAFSRKQILQPEDISLNDVASQALEILESSLGSKIEVTSYLSPDLYSVRGDFTQMQQVVMNLCLNARDAMPQGGRLVLETRNMRIGEEYCKRHADARPGSYVAISVSDTGTGMDAETLARIFEPFFTTKGPGKGTGLGLAVVYGIVNQHGGFIHAYSEVGAGTTFGIYLPAIHAEPDQEAPEADSDFPAGTECILVADDNEDFRAVAQETLKKLGYEIVAASDGKEALELFNANADRIRLLVLDVMMPGMQGTEVCEEVRKRFPGFPAVLVTGYSEKILDGWSEGKPNLRILSKPYSAHSLAKSVREALDSTGGGHTPC